MIAGTLDVLLVGGAELADFDALGAAGLQLERTASLPAAVGRLRAGSAALVVVGASVFEGRDRQAFAALRDAGAGAVLAVFPAQLAWRAPRAIVAGADDSVVLPADPGVVEARVANLVRWATAPARNAAAAPRNGGDVPGLPDDVAVLNRSVNDLDRLLEVAVEMFSGRCAARRCSVMLLDDAHTELTVRKSAGLTDSAPRSPVRLGEGLAGRVAQSGLPLLVADVDRLPGHAPAATPGSYRTRSCLLLPLRTPRGVLGVICLADKDGDRPFDETDLGGLTRLAGHAAQAIENAVQLRQVQELAAIDELTGLANRRRFQSSLARELQRARRYDRRLTLALFDVDFFKKYNDTCGHQAGDRALAAIGAILRSSLRDVDIVARYGGEEFAVILPETAARPGAGVSPFPFLERLRRSVETTAFPGEEKLPGGRLTISGGIACFPDDAENAEELIRKADEALYVSKGRGRNTITYRGAAVTE